MSDLENPLPKLEVAYSILFAVAATAGLATIPLVFSQALPSWVTPFFAVVFASSLLTGFVCLFLEKKLSHARKKTAQGIRGEMEEIERSFLSG